MKTGLGINHEIDARLWPGCDGLCHKYFWSAHKADGSQNRLHDETLLDSIASAFTVCLEQLSLLSISSGKRVDMVILQNHALLKEFARLDRLC